jgi:uncharacterized protein
VKLSQFAVFVPNFPSDGKYLVYNTFNQATAVIGERAKSFLCNPNAHSQENEEKYTNAFTDLGFLVDDSVDESAEFKNWYEETRYSKSLMRATILTTYDCNFACKYCIQEGVKNPARMDEEHSRGTVNWLINTIEEYNSEEVRLQFYGGEPLMNVRPMDYIASEIKEYSERTGISFGFIITTNGSLLKPDLVERLTPLGLESVKVTLDGDREGHNSKRPFKSGRGSFDVIINNILQVADKVKVRVNTNLDSENLESVPRMLDYLEQVGLRDRIDSIEFNPIVDIQGQDGISQLPHQVDCALASLGSPGTRISPPTSAREEWALDNLIQPTWDAFRRGFRTEKEVRLTICSMNLDGTAVVIDPLGRLYTCPAFVGREGFQVGSIDRIELSDRHREFMSLPVSEECFKCAYMPICSGGCKHMAYTRHGDLRATVCEKDYLRKVTAETLKMQILSQTQLVDSDQ